MPYTYFLRWNKTGRWYYGVRYAKTAHPSDLMETYFTSSKHVKKHIKEFGLPDEVKVTKIFDNENDARFWEVKFLKRTRAKDNPLCLNMTDNNSISRASCGHSKGKTYEQIYGIDRALSLRKQRAESNRTRKSPVWNAKSRKAASERYSGPKNPKAKKYIINGNKFSMQKEACQYIATIFPDVHPRSFLLYKEGSEIPKLDKLRIYYDTLSIEINRI